jgi:hypothetical protein
MAARYRFALGSGPADQPAHRGKSGRILAMDSVLAAPCADEHLSSGAPGRRLVLWEHAGGQPAHTIVIGRAPGRRRSCRWCYLHRCGLVHRLSHRRPFIVRQLAEFADRYRPRSPWRLASPGQRCAIHRPWPGTASALGPQAASRRAGQQVNPRFRRPPQPASTSVSPQPASRARNRAQDTPSSRHDSAFPGHDGLHEYPEQLATVP